MPKLSVTVITFNEEKNIERCLKSVLPVADEIIVVDSFSKDRTREICEKYQVVFIEHPFEGHIQQKNYALDQATYDHILSLDADEALTPELQKSILAIKQGNWTDEAYKFNRLTNFCGKWIKHTGWYPDTKVRLWNKKHGRWGGVNPHDKVVLENNIQAKHITGDLLHYSFYTLDQHMDQINKFSSIRAQEMHQSGRKVTWLKILLSPPIKFLKHYFLFGGFRDGYSGYVISKNSAHAVFLKYMKLKYLKMEDVK